MVKEGRRQRTLQRLLRFSGPQSAHFGERGQGFADPREGGLVGRNRKVPDRVPNELGWSAGGLEVREESVEENIATYIGRGVIEEHGCCGVSARYGSVCGRDFAP